MHIDQHELRDRNVLAAWALAVADVIRSAAEQSTGMAGGGPAALVAIVADPHMSIDDLRRVLALTHAGTVRLVDRLVERGWVERHQGSGRTVLLEATVMGRDASDRLSLARQEAIAKLLASMSKQAVSNAARLVEPVVHDVVDDVDAVRRFCRLCDRRVCDPCPAERSVDHRPNEPGCHHLAAHSPRGLT